MKEQHYLEMLLFIYLFKINKKASIFLFREHLFEGKKALELMVGWLPSLPRFLWVQRPNFKDCEPFVTSVVLCIVPYKQSPHPVQLLNQSINGHGIISHHLSFASFPKKIQGVCFPTWNLFGLLFFFFQ